MIMNEKELLKYISLERMLYNYDTYKLIELVKVSKLYNVQEATRKLGLNLITSNAGYWLIKDLEKLLIQ